MSDPPPRGLHSPAEALTARLAAELGPAAHDALDMALAKLSPEELGALEYNWPGFWARPKQLEPKGEWRSLGFLGGRGAGKPKMFSEYVHKEAMSGRARRIGLISQTIDDVRKVMVEGESGLLAIAPPWETPIWEPSLGRLTWPNGCFATALTAQEPAKIRGPQFHLIWGDELGSWPATQIDETWSNIAFALRLGYAKFVWSSTPSPTSIIKQLVDRDKRDTELSLSLKRPKIHYIGLGDIVLVGPYRGQASGQHIFTLVDAMGKASIDGGQGGGWGGGTEIARVKRSWVVESDKLWTRSERGLRPVVSWIDVSALRYGRALVSPIVVP